MISIFSIAGLATLSAGSIMHSSRSGLITPLFAASDWDKSNPIWFTVDFGSNDLNVHSAETCPLFIDCDEAKRNLNNLVFADGFSLGSHYWNEHSLPIEYFNDVAGVIGASPSSPLARSKLIMVGDADGNKFIRLMDKPDRNWEAISVVIDSSTNSWAIRGNMMTRNPKRNSQTPITASDGLIRLNLQSAAVSVPVEFANRFKSEKKVFSSSIRRRNHDSRLYVECSNTDRNVFDLELTGGMKVPIRIIGRSSADAGNNMCPTNLEFNEKGILSIGSSVLEYFNVVLDSTSGAIRFVLKQTSRNPVKFVKAPVFAFRFDSSSERKTDNGLMWGWTPSDGTYAADFILARAPVGSIRIMCLHNYCGGSPHPKLQWTTGTLQMQRQDDGSILVGEVHDWRSVENVVTNPSSSEFVIESRIIGYRMILDKARSIPGSVMEFVPAEGPKQKGELVFEQFPPVLAEYERDHIELPFSVMRSDRAPAFPVYPIWHGTPKFSVADGNRLIISVDARREIEYEVSISSGSLVFDEPFYRYRATPSERGIDFKSIGGSSERYEDEFAIPLRNWGVIKQANGAVDIHIRAVKGRELRPGDFPYIWGREPTVEFQKSGKSFSIDFLKQGHTSFKLVKRIQGSSGHIAIIPDEPGA